MKISTAGNESCNGIAGIVSERAKMKQLAQGFYRLFKEAQKKQCTSGNHLKLIYFVQNDEDPTPEQNSSVNIT